MPEPELECHYGREDAALAHLVRALLREASLEHPAGMLFAEGVAAALAAHLVAHYSTRPAMPVVGRGGLSGFRRRRLVDHVDAHLGDDLALVRLAEVVGLSPYHLSRAFKRSTGETLHRYVMGRRLERARERLMQADRPISELARDLGFVDQSHLTRLFRARFGVTPAAFAREHRTRLVLLPGSRQGAPERAKPFKIRTGGRR
jgi:AraC family transcriptional regulator